MASLNTQFSQIVKRIANRGAILSNVFHVWRANIKGYTFPSFSLIAKKLL